MVSPRVALVLGLSHLKRCERADNAGGLVSLCGREPQGVQLPAIGVDGEQQLVSAGRRAEERAGQELRGRERGERAQREHVGGRRAGAKVELERAAHGTQVGAAFGEQLAHAALRAHDAALLVLLGERGHCSAAGRSPLDDWILIAHSTAQLVAMYEKSDTRPKRDKTTLRQMCSRWSTHYIRGRLRVYA